MSEAWTIAISLLTGMGGMICVLLWAIYGRLGRLVMLLEALTLERWSAESLGKITRDIATGARRTGVGERGG